MGNPRPLLASLPTLLLLLLLHRPPGCGATCRSNQCRPTIPTQPAVIPPHSIPGKLPPPNPFCPRDVLKLAACADLLGGVINLAIGRAPTSGCCPLLGGLASAEVAACLCTALKANVLGAVAADLSLALSAVVGACGRQIPAGFRCM